MSLFFQAESYQKLCRQGNQGAGRRGLAPARISPKAQTRVYHVSRQGAGFEQQQMPLHIGCLFACNETSWFHSLS